MSGKQKKVLMISSSGGHWVQMNRLLPALASCEIHMACTEKSYREIAKGNRFYYVLDASQTSKLRLIIQALMVLLVVLRVRPDVVLTTGAAPGFFALFFAKKMGANTIWLDSIANVHELSLAGKKAQKYADLFLTQWPHLASENGPEYSGTVI